VWCGCCDPHSKPGRSCLPSLPIPEAAPHWIITQAQREKLSNCTIQDFSKIQSVALFYGIAAHACGGERVRAHLLGIHARAPASLNRHGSNLLLRWLVVHGGCRNRRVSGHGSRWRVASRQAPVRALCVVVHIESPAVTVRALLPARGKNMVLLLLLLLRMVDRGRGVLPQHISYRLIVNSPPFIQTQGGSRTQWTTHSPVRGCAALPAGRRSDPASAASAGGPGPSGLRTGPSQRHRPALLRETRRTETCRRDPAHTPHHTTPHHTTPHHTTPHHTTPHSSKVE
jgi:hypothetical protein